MEKIQIPARWEKMPNSKIILDGAHAIDRFQYLLPKIKRIPGKKIGIFGMARNHNLEDFHEVLPCFDMVIWTEVQGDREFWNMEEFAELFELLYSQAEGLERVIYEEDPIKALTIARKLDGTVVVMGSFYLCGKIRAVFFDSDAIMEIQDEFV